MFDLLKAIPEGGLFGIIAAQFAIMWAVLHQYYKSVEAHRKDTEKIHETYRKESIESASVQREDTKSMVTAMVQMKDALEVVKDAMDLVVRKLVD